MLALTMVVQDLETTTVELQRCRVEVGDQAEALSKAHAKLRELGHHKAMAIAELQAVCHAVSATAMPCVSRRRRRRRRHRRGLRQPPCDVMCCARLSDFCVDDSDARLPGQNVGRVFPDPARGVKQVPVRVSKTSCAPIVSHAP